MENKEVKNEEVKEEMVVYGMDDVKSIINAIDNIKTNSFAPYELLCSIKMFLQNGAKEIK